MDQRHQQYVDYYAARLAKYEGDARYPHSAAAERAMFEAISTAATLEEFGERVAREALPLRCAVARVRDTETAEAQQYLALEETVRAEPHLEVLRQLDAAPPATVEELNGMVSAVHTRWMPRISADEALRDAFWDDWQLLEDLACEELAEVPERWHAERRAHVARELARGAAHHREHTLPELRKFVPDYAPDWDALWQPRHRRRFPVADAVVAERIAGHRRYVGVK